MLHLFYFILFYLVHYEASDNIISTSTEQDVMCSRMPQDKSDTSLMSHQVDDWLVKVAIQSNVWNLPDLDCTVLTRTGDDVIVVWTPLDVEYSSTVSGH